MTIWVITIVCALLAAALCCALAVGVPRGRAALIGRALVAVIAGVVVAELLTTALLPRAVSEHIDLDAAHAAASDPAVTAAASARARAVAARGAADSSVEQARDARDRALVIARCEYRPTAGCPQVSITGDPGRGAEAATANDRLAAAQAELDRAAVTRDGRAADLDDRVGDADATLAAARTAAMTGADHGPGARWLAMNSVTGADGGALALRLALWLVCAALALLPLLFRFWRGVTARDVWAEQELEREKIAAAAQLEVHTHSARRQVALLAGEAVDDAPTTQFAMPDGWEVTSRRYLRELPAEPDPELEREPAPKPSDRSIPAHRRDGAAPRGAPQASDLLPIAAAAEAASLTAETEENDLVGKHAASEPNLPAVVTETRPVPVTVSPAPAPAVPARLAQSERKPNPFIPPVIDDVAQAAARWARPFLPPIVTRVFDGAAAPMRTARQAFEEVEEVTFSLRRSRKVTVDTTSVPEEQAPNGQPSLPQTHFRGPARTGPDFASPDFASPDFVAAHFAGPNHRGSDDPEPLDVPYEIDGATFEPLGRGGRGGELPG